VVSSIYHRNEWQSEVVRGYVVSHLVVELCV
jgi:hypothetical protein